MEIEIAEAVAIYCLARLSSNAKACLELDPLIEEMRSVFEAEKGKKLTDVRSACVREIAIDLILHGLDKKQYGACHLTI